MRYKFLKKLSLLDYFVVFIILLAIAFSIRFLTREQRFVYLHIETGSPEWVGEQIPGFYWLVNSIRVGDIVFTTTGNQIGKVIEVYNVDWRGDRRYSRLKLQVNTVFDRRTNEYRINDVPLSVGNDADFKIGNTAYKGTITYIGNTLDPQNYAERYLRIRIKVLRTEPWKADTLNESFETKSTNGKVVFKVVDSVVTRSESTEVNSSGVRVRTLDPIFKDVYLTAIIYVTCQEEVCYFNGSLPVKVGVPITVQSPTSLIEGVRNVGKGSIISIEETPADFNLEEL